MLTTCLFASPETSVIPNPRAFYLPPLERDGVRDLLSVLQLGRPEDIKTAGNGSDWAANLDYTGGCPPWGNRTSVELCKIPGLGQILELLLRGLKFLIPLLDDRR
jgi:hypothetical protein